MIENEDLNFLTQFYSYLLLPRYFILTLKKYFFTECGAYGSSNWTNFWQMFVGETS